MSYCENSSGKCFALDANCLWYLIWIKQIINDKSGLFRWVWLRTCQMKKGFLSIFSWIYTVCTSLMKKKKKKKKKKDSAAFVWGVVQGAYFPLLKVGRKEGSLGFQWFLEALWSILLSDRVCVFTFAQEYICTIFQPMTWLSFNACFKNMPLGIYLVCGWSWDQIYFNFLFFLMSISLFYVI